MKTVSSFYQQIVTFLKGLAATLASFVPTALPRGRTDFENWAESIIAQAGLPDNRSTRFALYVMIMHLPSTTAKKPKRYFVQSMQKAASNEVAHALIMEIKKAQEADVRAAQEDAAKKAGIGEVTPTTGVAPNVLPLKP